MKSYFEAEPEESIGTASTVLASLPLSSLLAHGARRLGHSWKPMVLGNFNLLPSGTDLEATWKFTAILAIIELIQFIMGPTHLL